ncbi:hypothetical protein CF134_18780 [Aeromonas salmonicida]|uniref:AP65-gp36-type tail fiber protein n=1 Tax=Aeromonas salmonicida subsp. pectinolytica 34mel TaxID=1324960 RepID=A0A2D1QH93_AERSA|nr:pyocin knob domain-containing protein [Aeromonas salmonicida]ATP09799.1 AP65-gp36-type tail fiber protein [Aeromonas salmonicida subsp. pectinolytica 34mel]TNI11969.1 hypothetical protein CF134_18780 [Aeromonas salmonicida]
MAQEKVLDIVKSTKSILTPYNVVADGKITSNKNAGLENMDDVYAQRMVLSGSQGYFQAGKKDRDINDQKMMFSGWFGTPLSQFRISMASGIQPQVYQGGVNYDILHRGNMPTPEDIKAMAIYDRPTGDDCNNAVLPGNYGVLANTVNTPYGIGPSGSTLLVTRWGNGANAQIFFTYGEDRVFVRRQYVGVWKPWFELYSTSNKQPVGGMGLGVGDATNALTITGNVRDFNLAKTNGTFTVEGAWANGIDNSPTATAHTGILQVSQRAFDNFTIQKFTRQTNTGGFAQEVQFMRAWNNATDGWSPWLPSGSWESVNTYRTGILRHNNSTNDDSVYPYVSYTKEKYRDAVAPGTYYTVGEISFRAGSANRYDPHSGDQLSKILGMVTNTATAGEYDGSLFLASRLRRADGTVSDSSILTINRDMGAEFTHAAKKVQINTGRVTADDFLQNTAQSGLANSSTRKDYVDSEVGTKVSKSGDTMTGALRISNNFHSVRDGIDKLTISTGTSDVYFRNGISSKVLQLKDNGSLEYSNQKIYHEGYKPTSTELGVVNIAGDVMTGNLVVDAGTTAEPQVGVRRSGRRLYMADNGVTVGLYNIIGESFINTFMISRNINDGNIIVGSDSNNTIIRGAGNLKHGTADIYTTDNRPSPADIGTMTTAQINTELAKQVSKTGDTMTGNLTAPKVLLSAAQGTEVNSAARRDFVISECAKQVTKTGDTMTGNLTAPKVLLSSAQGTEANSSTRKDYVDGLIAQQVSKTGDTMTGQLVLHTDVPIQLKSSTPGVARPQYIVANDSTGAQRWYVGQASANSADVLLNSTGNGTYLRLEANQISFNKNPISTAAQGAAAGSLVRRDFLESSLSIQTPSGALQIGGSANLNNYQTAGFYFQDSNASAGSGSNYPTAQAGSLVVTKAAGIIQEYTVYGTGARYIRTFYSPNWSAWAMTYDSLRPPSASAVGALPITGGTVNGNVTIVPSTAGQFRINLGGTYLEMGPKNSGYAHFTTNAGSGFYFYQPITCVGSISAAGLYDGGARVYSTNNPPPSAQAAGDQLAGASYSAIGQFAMMTVAVNIGARGPGFVTAGSNLRWCSAEGNNVSSSVPPGNWRLMGYVIEGTYARWNTSLWQRVS